MGHERFASLMYEAGVRAAILPDLPLEEVGPWATAADPAGIETVMLAAPTAPDERLPRVVARSRGFVYAVGLLGVTGERDALAASSLVIARRLKAITDKPVLVGVGVSNGQQAAEVSQVADGCVIGSALMRRVVEGEGPAGAGAFIAEVRAALDAS
jgi:tryptophan synthase alpha chain